MTRREWLAQAAGLGVSALIPQRAAAIDPPIRLPLGFSLYGMKSLKLADAIRTCSEIGYDGVELALMPGWPSTPATLSPTDRKDLRKWLIDAKLSLHGLMENLTEPSGDTAHKANLDRLKAAADLGHTVTPGDPVVIETILGGRPADWEKVRGLLVERLGAWAAVGKAAKAVIAIKPHVANALHTTADATWLVKQIDSPWLRLAYDPSHFTLRGVKPSDSAETLAPLAAFVHVKDAKGAPEKFEFLLPGDGNTDYLALARALVAAGYRGPVVVEVSGLISNKAGYDPVAAARRCFANLSGAFGKAKAP